MPSFFCFRDQRKCPRPPRSIVHDSDPPNYLNESKNEWRHIIFGTLILSKKRKWWTRRAPQHSLYQFLKILNMRSISSDKYEMGIFGLFTSTQRTPPTHTPLREVQPAFRLPPMHNIDWCQRVPTIWFVPEKTNIRRWTQWSWSNGTHRLITTHNVQDPNVN